MHRLHTALAAGALAIAGLLGSSSAAAAINVLACEPEWQALVQEIGGDKVVATSATSALQDRTGSKRGPA